MRSLIRAGLESTVLLIVVDLICQLAPLAGLVQVIAALAGHRARARRCAEPPRQRGYSRRQYRAIYELEVKQYTLLPIL